ncbi:MAG: drug/metabolite transporter (DMT)-like permease [Bacteroidia bacterium]|jgi:drug/metabolite transporter (DMT)-like permease
MFLFLSILCSSLINLVFRYFPKYQVDNQQAIAVNYWTCVVTGLMTAQLTIGQTTAYYSASWGIYTIGLGLLFVTVFYGMAVTAQKFGISVSVIAAKMGVVFPVIYAFIFLHDQPNVLLIFGIVLSLVSVYFVSKKDKKISHNVSGLGLMLLPVLVLLGSGVIDTSLKIIEQNIGNTSAAIPTILIFLAAAGFGTVITIYRVATGKTQITRQSVIGGIALGVPNYFSIFFLFKALQSDFFITSQVYPLNNIGIVVLSTVMSVIIFREHLNRKNLIGVAMAILAIVLISLPS